MNSTLKILLLSIGLLGCLMTQAADAQGVANAADPLSLFDRQNDQAESQVLPVGHFFPGGQDSACCDTPCDGGCDSACSETSCDAIGCCDPCQKTCNCCKCRETLTGDWWGKRTVLAECGVRYDASFTQFYQGVSSGGAKETFRYGGKVDQYFTFSSEKLGLWKGGELIMHAETNYGRNSILDAAAMAPANTAALFPRPTDLPVTAITHLQFMQQLGGGYAITAGKFNFLDLWGQFYPDYGKGLDGFMNTSSIIFLNVVPTLPIVFNGAGIVKAGEKGVEAAIMAVDTNTTSTVSGVSDLFDEGITVLGIGRVFTEFGGLPGSQLIGGTWSSKNYTSFERTGWSFHPGDGITIPTETDSWLAAYVGEQTLWMDPCNKKRKAWFTTTWGMSDQHTSPYKWAGTASIEAIGLNQNRPHDRMGISYFYSSVSDQLQDLVGPLVGLQDLQGGEFYYNAEINPWFHLTGDIQAIQTEVASQDAAIVMGVRAKITL